jgi:hypothetical protein
MSHPHPLFHCQTPSVTLASPLQQLSEKSRFHDEPVDSVKYQIGTVRIDCNLFFLWVNKSSATPETGNSSSGRAYGAMRTLARNGIRFRCFSIWIRSPDAIPRIPSIRSASAHRVVPALA